MSTDMIWQAQSTGSADTERLGTALGNLLKPPAVIELRSDLGGGKTTFVRGLAAGLGSQDRVASPTFTLNKIYKANKNLQASRVDAAQGDGEERKENVRNDTLTASRSHQRSDAPQAPVALPASAGGQTGAASGLEIHHFDFYRLDDPGVVSDQLEESLQNSRVITVVEWSDIVQGILPPERLTIEFKPVKDNPDERQITFHYSESLRDVVEKLETNLAEPEP